MFGAALALSTFFALSFVFYNAEDAAKRNTRTAIDFIFYQLPPNPKQIIGDYVNGTRTSRVWDLVARDAKIRLAFGLNDCYGQKQFVFCYFAHLVSPFSAPAGIVIKQAVAEGNNVVVFHEATLDHPDGYTYTNTVPAYFEFDKKGKIVSLYTEVVNIQWNQEPMDTAAGNIAGACFYALSACNATYDPDGYFRNQTECVDYMTTLPEPLNWGYLTSNSVPCRLFQGEYALYDPFEYCTALGRAPKRYCVNRPSSTFYPNNFLGTYKSVA